MRSVYLASVAIHLIAALVWLGGLFFLGLVGAPALRRVSSEEERRRLFDDIGRRFRAVGWTAIAVLVLTGALNMYFRGWLDAELLGSAAFWQGASGRALAMKLLLVAAMLAVSAKHDFVDGPAAGRALPGSDEARALRRRAVLFARVNVVLGLLLAVAAARLVRP